MMRSAEFWVTNVIASIQSSAACTWISNLTPAIKLFTSTAVQVGRCSLKNLSPIFVNFSTTSMPNPSALNVLTE